MQTPVNPFKQALRRKAADRPVARPGRRTTAAEICAGAGFDWLLIDGEHSPNDLRTILQQAQVIAAYPGVARDRAGAGGPRPVGTALIKQYLDLGIQTLLVPMVDTPQQARRARARHALPAARASAAWAARAPRAGAAIRTTRKEANEQVCLLVQAETREALNNLDAIAATDGVDGVFIGPADLSASLGHVGNPGHPEVQAAIDDAIARITAAGKAAGILTPDEALARKYLELGATSSPWAWTPTCWCKATSELAAKFKAAAARPPGRARRY